MMPPTAPPDTPPLGGGGVAPLPLPLPDGAGVVNMLPPYAARWSIIDPTRQLFAAVQLATTTTKY